MIVHTPSERPARFKRGNDALAYCVVSRFESIVTASILGCGCLREGAHPVPRSPVSPGAPDANSSSMLAALVCGGAVTFAPPTMITRPEVVPRHVSTVMSTPSEVLGRRSALLAFAALPIASAHADSIAVRDHRRTRERGLQGSVECIAACIFVHLTPMFALGIAGHCR